jgi:hypothetical protein
MLTINYYLWKYVLRALQTQPIMKIGVG